MTAADGQNAAAGISVRIRKPGKRRDLAAFEVKVEKDIKQCMQCRFFLRQQQTMHCEGVCKEAPAEGDR